MFSEKVRSVAVAHTLANHGEQALTWHGGSCEVIE